MEETKNNRPSAERILSLLVDLLADQHHVKVKYQIIKEELASVEGGAAV